MTSCIYRKYITYRNAVRGESSYGHRKQAAKIWRSSAMWFSRYASGQTDILIIILRPRLFEGGEVIYMHVVGITLPETGSTARCCSWVSGDHVTDHVTRAPVDDVSRASTVDAEKTRTQMINHRPSTDSPAIISCWLIHLHTYTAISKR